MKKRIVLLMICALLLAFTGCANNQSGSIQTEDALADSSQSETVEQAIDKQTDSEADGTSDQAAADATDGKSGESAAGQADDSEKDSEEIKTARTISTTTHSIEGSQITELLIMQPDDTLEIEMKINSDTKEHAALVTAIYAIDVNESVEDSDTINVGIIETKVNGSQAQVNYKVTKKGATFSGIDENGNAVEGQPQWYLEAISGIDLSNTMSSYAINLVNAYNDAIN